jgi:hypothetical protein
VVIDDVQDLDVGPVGQRPVGDVGLPPLVRHLRLEPHERAPRPLVRLWGDEASSGKHPPDRGNGRSPSMPPVQVDSDRVRPGVKPLIDKELSQFDDLLLDLIGYPVRARPRAPGARFKPCVSLGLEPTHELVDPPP